MGPPEKQSEEHFFDPDSMDWVRLMQMPQILMPPTADMRVVKGWILLKTPAGAPSEKDSLYVCDET